MNSAAEQPVYMGLPEARFLLPRLGVAGLLCLPLLFLSMGPMLPGFEFIGHATWNGPLQWLLATPIFLWSGQPFLRRWWKSIRERDPNMFTLVVSGTGAAYVYSCAALFLGRYFPETLRGTHGVPLYFEVCGVTTAIVLLGQILEQRANGRTESALQALLALAPPLAHRVSDGLEEDIPLGEVRVGDLLRIRPGEAVPVDGLVAEGRSEIDESMLTGEPMPVLRQPGELVRAGTLNTNSSLLVQASKVGSDTLLASIIALVREAQETAAPIQRITDKAVAWFAPLVGGVSLLTFGLWLYFGTSPALPAALLSAIAVLLVSCPCTLGLATPVAIVTGVGRAAKAGILIRRAEILERLAQVDTIFMDKTGTLTEGCPRLIRVSSEEASYDERVILHLASSVESPSEHPLARAVLAHASAKGIKPSPVEGFLSIAGVGVKAKLDGRLVELSTRNDAPGAETGTCVQVCVEGNRVATLLFEDTLRAEAAPLVRQLQQLGLRLVILSGDRLPSVERVARLLGIKEFHASLSPAGKLALVKQAQARGSRALFAGDGINDAPSLAAAFVGAAMGTGTGVALASADLILLQGNLGNLAAALQLGRKTMRIIKQNLFWAFFYNSLCIPLAAGALYPLLGWTLNPMAASIAMCLSSISVVSNSLRLLHTRL